MSNQTLVESFGGFFTISDWAMAYLPQLILAIILLLLGFATGKILRYGVIKLGEITGFDKISSSTNKILRKFGYKKTTIEFMGGVIMWVTFLFFVGVAVQYIFGERILTQTITAIAIFLPKVVLAIVVIILGLILGDVFGNIAKGIIESLFPNLKDKNLISFFSGGMTKLLVFLIGIIIALDVLGIYVEVFTMGFAVILLSISLIIIVGSKDLLLNLFAGIYIQSSGNLRKGMEIEFDNNKGIIKEIGMIHTKVEIKKDEVQIPNHLFMKKICKVR